MRIERIINLVTEAAKGNDNFKEGVVGSNGYGFVFKDIDFYSKVPYIFSIGSHKFCGAGSSCNILKNWKKVNNFEDLQNFSRFDEDNDLLLAGSPKKFKNPNRFLT